MMERIRALRYDRLYMIWGGLFALTAVLGLVFPGAEGFGRALLLVCTAGFFLPPWLILAKATPLWINLPDFYLDFCWSSKSVIFLFSQGS